MFGFFKIIMKTCLFIEYIDDFIDLWQSTLTKKSSIESSCFYIYNRLFYFPFWVTKYPTTTLLHDSLVMNGKNQLCFSLAHGKLNYVGWYLQVDLCPLQLTTRNSNKRTSVSITMKSIMLLSRNLRALFAARRNDNKMWYFSVHR